MSDDRRVETLPTPEQVIEAYLLRREEATELASGDAVETARAARAVLTEFMRRYPHAADALADSAAVGSIIENSPDADGRSGSERLRKKRRSSVAGWKMATRLLAARQTSVAPAVPAPLSGLRKEAEACGLTIQALASATRMSVPLLVKLDRRLIRFASIPRQVIERIGAELGRTFEAVAAYLQGDPQFASQASFRADAAPQMPGQQDFFEAVETDLTMEETQKAEWRRFKNAP